MGCFVRWWPLAAVVAAGVIGVVVWSRRDPLPGEVAYIDALQRLGGPVPDLAEFVRVTTGTEAALVVLAAAAPWLLWRSRSAGAVAIGVLVLTMLVVQPTTKQMVDRPRPTPDQVDVRADHASMSYPSGHSMSTTVVWGLAVGLCLSRQWYAMAALATTPIVLTFFSSGIQGVHWPSDAVGGTLLGAASAAVAVRVLAATSATGPPHHSTTATASISTRKPGPRPDTT